MTKRSTLKIERERKFLVKPELLPANLAENEHFKIEQYYITQPGDSVEVRVRSQVRKKETKYFLTIKKKIENGDKSERYENEIEITNEMFHRLLYNAECKKVAKERFLVKMESGLIAEVDVYDYDPNAPILGKNIVAEIEIKNKDQFADLVLPPWIGEEVTGRPEYGNAQMAENGFPKNMRK